MRIPGIGTLVAAVALARCRVASIEPVPVIQKRKLTPVRVSAKPPLAAFARAEVALG
jgi:hypothetical protein